MSLACPKCGTILDQDFGLVNCTGCKSVLAIDVEGNVQIADSTIAADVPLGMENFQEQPVEAEFQDLDQLMSAAEAPAGIELDAADVHAMNTAPEEPSEYLVENEGLHESIQRDMPQPEPQQAMPDLEEGTTSDRTWVSTSPAPEVPMKPGPLDDITSFGNKDTSSGPFTYTMVLENIDLAEARKKLQEVTSEPRFGWDPREVMKRVKSGKLTLEGLTPAQAVMLVRMLRGSQIQISWSQHVYS